MRFVVLPSFERSLKSLGEDERSLVVTALGTFNQFVVSGTVPHGLGIKKLRNEQYEFRASLKMRVIFEREDDVIYLVLVGNHDDIRRFLR